MFKVALAIGIGYLLSAAMTLNVSLRVPDGIVLASDSLGTLIQSIDQKINVPATCQSCGTKFELKDVKTPPLSVPSSTWPYVQKMYSLRGAAGLATFGSGQVNSRSIYNHAIEVESKLPDPKDSDFLDKTANFVADYFKDQLLAEWKKNGIDAGMQPDDFSPLGFQLSGFVRDPNGDPVPTTYIIRIAKKPILDKHISTGCTWTGDGTVMALLFGGGAAAIQPNFFAFSLQDAIDYSKFLIKTTADFQRFSGRLPTVGGEIDIALITNHRGFRWIAQKELYRMLDKPEITS